MGNSTDQDREQLLHLVRDEWVEHGTSTEDTLQLDRDRCEWHVRDAIEASGGKTLSFLSVWVQSPMAGVLAAASLRGGMGKPKGKELKAHLAAGVAGASPRAQRVRREVDDTVGLARDAVHAQLAAELQNRTPEWSQLAHDMRNHAWNAVWEEIGDPVFTNCGFEKAARESYDLMEPNLQWWEEDLMAGQFAAGEMALLDAENLDAEVDVSAYDGTRRLAMHCSWWWATSNTAVLCERPARFEVSGKRVSIEYRDGWTVQT